MNCNNIKIFGLAAACFALGTITQIFLPDILIVLIFACILLVVGIFILKS